MKSVSPLLVLLLAASLVLGLAACGQEPAPAPSSSILEEQRPLPSSQTPDSSAESASEPAPSPSSMAEFPPAVPSPSSGVPVSPSSQAPSPSATRDDGPIFSVSTDTVKAGDNIFLFAENLPEDAKVTGETDLDFTPTFYAYDGKWVAAMPIRYTLEPGSYQITIRSGEDSHTFPIAVTDGGFEVETFTVDQSVADSTINDGGANAEYEQVTRPLKNMGDNEKYWSGKFAMPLRQEALKVSSSFGYTRIVNGVASIHGGVDFPAPQGTPVTAPNRGRVLFAGFLKLTGNTVVVEHGFGLKSWYYHMDSLDCKTGDMLETGDPIGKVGTTGFSTGNHLHFAMSVNNIYVNPWQYLENDMLD